MSSDHKTVKCIIYQLGAGRCFHSLDYRIIMASNQEFCYVSEWECDEGDNEESEIDHGEGEEAGRGLTKNQKAWNSCDKLKADANYHQRYIPLKDALGFRHLSSEEKAKFVKDKALAEEDGLFLSSEEAVNCLERFSSAVVCITVKLTSSQAYGTGFFIRENNEDVVITNSHSIRSSQSGTGIDFRLVKPGNVRVTSFYNGNGSLQETRKVARIERASPPDKNKDKNVLEASLKGNLHGEGKSDTDDVSKCDVALKLLSSYFSRRDAFLDYALLYLLPMENDDQKAKFATVKPLEMKAFDKLENFRNVSSFGFPDPRSLKYPRSLRLLTICHPHRASTQVSFGGMLSDLQHVYFLNMTYGQNDTGMLNGKDPFVKHSIATCKGSSGAPIFAFVVNHETGEVKVDECVYFLHFYGENVEGQFRGKAVSFSTIIRNLELRAIHNKLGAALAEVGSPAEDEEH